MRPRVPGWTPRVLQCSSLLGEGIDAVWDAVEDFRAAVGTALAGRRAQQAREWMWSEVTEALLEALHRDERVAALAKRLEEAVAAGTDNAHGGGAGDRGGISRFRSRTERFVSFLRSEAEKPDKLLMKSDTILVLSALLGVVVLALVCMKRVGRQAASTVDRVTELLERNEARFRAMVRDSSDIMAIIDERGYLTYASPATERILGLDSDALIGTNAFDLVHPDDLPVALHAFDVATSDPDAGDRVEFRMNHADGGWRTVEAVSTNLVHDPSIAGLVVSARDVTDRRYAEAELREAQERFRSAFEHAPIGMALMSLDGELFRVNHAMVQILGRSTEELLRTTVGDLTHPDDHEACAEALGHLLSRQAPSWQLDLRFIHHSGHLVWVALSWSLVRDLEGNALYFVCQMEDITERKASGEALAHQAIHDPLTGLPNRTLFVERLGRESGAFCRHAQPDGRPVPRPRPFQGGQRQPRALGGRPAARRGCRPPEQRDAPRRRRRALRG